MKRRRCLKEAVLPCLPPLFPTAVGSVTSLSNTAASRSTHVMEFFRLTFTENNRVHSPSPRRDARRTLQGADLCVTGWIIILAWFSDSVSRVDCGAFPVKICAHINIYEGYALPHDKLGRLPCRASVEDSH